MTPSRRRLHVYAVVLTAFVGSAEEAQALLIHPPNITPESSYLEYAQNFPESGWIARQDATLTMPEFGGGGTLIHPNFVLTAAHAVRAQNPSTGMPYENFSFNLSDNYLTNASATTAASEIIVHPDFRSVRRGPDLALLYFETPITSVQLAKVFDGEPMVGDESSLAGYGLPGTPGNLQEADGQKRAARNFIETKDFDPGYVETFFARSIFSGFSPLGALATPGDSGSSGRLLVDGEYQVAAVASTWSSFPNYGGINTYSYIDAQAYSWISTTIASRTVPEPSTGILLLTVGCVLLRGRR